MMNKTIKRIATVGVIALSSYLLGTAQVTTATKAQMVSEATPTQQRVMTGNYHDYMVINTVDGNGWLLDDTEESPYIKDDIAIFEDGELVQVVFDTMGTEKVEDDIIISVKSQEAK